MSPNRSGLGVGLIVLSAVCFGTLAIFGKVGYRLGLSLPTLLGYRFTLAALALWAVVRLRSSPLPPRNRLIGLAVMGAVGYVGQSAAYFGALRYIPASTTALLLYTYPAVVTLLAALLFRETLNWRRGLALGMAFIGTLLVVQAQFQAVAPIGLVLALLSAAMYSSYILFGSRILPAVPPVSASATILTAAAAVLLSYAAATGQLTFQPAVDRVVLLVAFALLATAVPVLAFIAGLQLIGPSRAAILSTFEPATTVLLAVIILGEAAQPLQFLGGALVVGSALLLEAPGWHRSKAPAETTCE